MSAFLLPIIRETLASKATGRSGTQNHKLNPNPQTPTPSPHRMADVDKSYCDMLNKTQTLRKTCPSAAVMRVGFSERGTIIGWPSRGLPTITQRASPTCDLS